MVANKFQMIEYYRRRAAELQEQVNHSLQRADELTRDCDHLYPNEESAVVEQPGGGKVCSICLFTVGI